MASELLDSLARWPGGPFDEAHLIPAYRPFKNRLDPYLQDAEVLRMVQSICKNQPIRCVYVCNDLMLMAQAALHYGKRYWAARGVYLEDGTAAYWGGHNKVALFRRVMINRILTGAWWQRHPRMHGVTPWLDERRAIFPELVRTELARYAWKPISPEPLLSERFGSWLSSYLEEAGVPERHRSGLDALVSVSHSSIGDVVPGYADAMRGIVYALQAKGLMVGLKYHPREVKGQYLGLDDMPGVVHLPAYIGAEFIFVAARARLQYHIGDITSTLMTVRWLLPHVEAYSFLPDNLRWRTLRAPFEGCGVKVFENADDLIAGLRALPGT